MKTNPYTNRQQLGMSRISAIQSLTRTVSNGLAPTLVRVSVLIPAAVAFAMRGVYGYNRLYVPSEELIATQVYAGSVLVQHPHQISTQRDAVQFEGEYVLNEF